MSQFTSELLRRELKADDEGWLIDSAGGSYETAAEYMNHLFGFCGCGMPEAALEYVRDHMQAIHDLRESEYDAAQWKAMDAKFHSDGERYFFWYRLDDLGLTEHGGSVPGWLTDKGREWLTALNEATDKGGCDGG